MGRRESDGKSPEAKGTWRLPETAKGSDSQVGFPKEAVSEVVTGGWGVHEGALLGSTCGREGRREED